MFDHQQHVNSSKVLINWHLISSLAVTKEMGKYLKVAYSSQHAFKCSGKS